MTPPGVPATEEAGHGGREAGLAIGIWFVIGLVVLGYLYVRHPERLPELKRVYADEAPAKVPADT